MKLEILSRDVRAFDPSSPKHLGTVLVLDPGIENLDLLTPEISRSFAILALL